jgi:5-(hydroxymethyl)furfural/furfural oxidase
MDDADFLIVGGGTAGCVLASRLSEDASLKIVLIEAGADTPPGSVPADIDDIFPRAYANSAYFWPDLRAVARAGSASKPYSQARILGGGSSIMGLWSLRGLPEDYDNWAAAGASGWAFADVLPFFRKLERDVDIASPEHGSDGPTTIARIQVESWPPFNKALAEAAAKAGLRILSDANSTEIDGVFAIPTAAESGARVSAPRAYLTEAVRRRPNLKLLTGTEARRILFEGKRATGAAIRRSDGSSGTLRGHAVILSAGAIHTPALLMRSGIGPSEALKAAGIDVVHDEKRVGANLQNHVFLHLGAVIRPGMRQSPSLRNYAIGGARLSSGPNASAGDLFVSFISRTSAYPNGNRLGMVGPSLYAPFSRGAVRLDPKNPGGEPLVDFNLLADPRDAERLLYAARFARVLLQDARVRATTLEAFVLPPNPPVRLLNQPGMSSAVLGHAIAAMVALPTPARRAALRRVIAPGKLLGDISDEDEFSELAIAGATPMFHPASTCAMGAVVDPLARVIGVENMRVVDASMMPGIPRGNTNIPTLMLAEKCAAQFRAEPRGRASSSSVALATGEGDHAKHGGGGET